MYRKISEEKKFQGKTLAVYRNSYLIDDAIVKLEYMHVPSVALMIALTEDNKFILIEQYRQAVDGLSIEFPAGKIEKDEEPQIAASREAIEEAGIYANEIIKLGNIHSSPEFSNEIVYVYMAKKFKEVTPAPEVHEKIKIIKLDLDEFVSHILSGKITDSKTISAYLLYLLKK